MGETPDVDGAVARIETLLDEFGDRLDPRARQKAEELVQSLMEVYGAGLARILELIRESGGAAQPLLERMMDDKLVASLLLIHGLHVVDSRTRIREALSRVGRRLAPEAIEFLDVTDGVAHVRINNGSNGCGSTAGQLAELVERTVREAAPEIEQVDIEEAARSSPLVQIAPPATA
jgi:NifU-like domain